MILIVIGGGVLLIVIIVIVVLIIVKGKRQKVAKTKPDENVTSSVAVPNPDVAEAVFSLQDTAGQNPDDNEESARYPHGESRMSILPPIRTHEPVIQPIQEIDEAEAMRIVDKQSEELINSAEHSLHD